MESGDDDILDYIGVFKEATITDESYIKLYKLVNNCVKSYYHYAYLLTCEYFYLLPTGIRIKKEACLSSPSEQFKNDWADNINKTEVEMVKLLIDEHENNYLHFERQFWYNLVSLLASLEEHDEFYKWWIKLSNHLEKEARKESRKKLKKLKKLDATVDITYFENIISSFALFHNIEQFKAMYRKM